MGRLVGFVAALATAAVTLASPSVTAGTVRPVRVALPMERFWALTVDADRERMLVSAGPYGDTVAVLDFDGNLVHTLSGLDGPAGMTIVGGVLYVALHGSGEIASFDARTYHSLGPVATGLHDPLDLVVTGGRLWSITGCGEDHYYQSDPYTYREIVDVDLSSGRVGRREMYPVNHQCRLSASPWAPDILLTWSPNRSGTPLSVLDVSGAEPRQVRHESLAVANLADIAILPDGDHFLVAAGHPYTLLEYRMIDLQPTGRSYQVGAYPNTVAVASASRDAETVFVAGRHAAYWADAHVFGPGGPDDERAQYQAGGAEMQLYPRGIEFHPHNPRRFYAVVGNHHSSAPSVFLDIVDWFDPTVQTRHYVAGGTSSVSCRPSESADVGGACFSVPAGSNRIDVEIADASGLPIAAVAEFDNGEQRQFCRALRLDDIWHDVKAIRIRTVSAPTSVCGGPSASTTGVVTLTGR